MSTESFDVVVIGGGQAGLATGHFLARRGLRFTILDAHDRIGESWRRRWDALLLFTSARFDGLPGMPFPASKRHFPSKDEAADYLVEYARRMELPVRLGVSVEGLRRTDDGAGFVVDAGHDRYEAPQVVIASGAFHEPRIPGFAARLDPAIRQLHSSEYRNVGQLQPGGVLVVGASNSGGEIAHDVAQHGHETWLVGRDTGEMPFDINGRVAKLFDPPFWFFLNHVATIRTPIGRRVRPFLQEHGGPLERVRKADLEAAGVTRVFARATGERGGRPEIENGDVLDVANVIWATGSRHDYPWVELPIVGADGWPIHERGVVPHVPGLYFVGLPFQYAAGSHLLGGVGRDARFVVDRVARRAGGG
jgi:putative flavoprotein involved in K+ transport